jgi:uncharacterized membrane protein YpjA
MYLKPVGTSSYALSSLTYTAYNTNHLVAITANTVKPFMNKACDYAFVDRVLETNIENYQSKIGEFNNYVDQAATAF